MKRLRLFTKKIKKLFANKTSRIVVLAIATVTVAGASWVFTILLLKADTSTTASFQAEAGTTSGTASVISDATASGGSALQFTSSGSTGVVPVGVPGNWALKFNDEFDGTSLDLNKWSNCWFSPGCGTQNNVATSPANVSVSGGNLILTLASSSSGASVTTNPKGGAKVGYQFQYGVAEARVSFPGNGTKCYNWPAWWTDGQSWPTNGENDIAEVLSGNMTVNYHSSSGSHNQGAVPGYWCGGFHVYTLYRQPGKSDVYYDGIKVKSYATDDDGAPHYLLLNIGKSSSTAAYGTDSQIKVDYVRAWQ